MANRIPRFQVMARDGFRCIYCGATPKTTELHLDHVVPKSLGGSDETWNLATACVSCNASKSNLMPSDEVIREVYERDSVWPYLGKREQHRPCFHCGKPVLIEPEDDLPDDLVRCEPCDGTVCDFYSQGWHAGFQRAEELMEETIRTEIQRLMMEARR